jgi:hypothetical protein
MKVQTMLLAAALSVTSLAVLAQGSAKGGSGGAGGQSAGQTSGEASTRAGGATGESERDRPNRQKDRASTPSDNPPGSSGVPTTGATGATTDQENNH